MTTNSRPVALITGGSRGLGLALTTALARRGWHVVIDARDGERLAAALARVDATVPGSVTALAGDVSDPLHRARLAGAAAAAGRLDLLVNNASVLGPSPQPTLADYPVQTLHDVYATNVLAPLALWQLALPLLQRSNGITVQVSSDAAVEAYEGWGGYGSSKAALDQLTAVMAAENPSLRVYAFDPGDMATDLHQQAFPGQDISDRPAPETVVPALLDVIDRRPPSGRYRAADVGAASDVGVAGDNEVVSGIDVQVAR